MTEDDHGNFLSHTTKFDYKDGIGYADEIETKRLDKQGNGTATFIGDTYLIRHIYEWVKTEKLEDEDGDIFKIVPKDDYKVKKSLSSMCLSYVSLHITGTIKFGKYVIPYSWKKGI